jgi:hypothetical protein
MFNNYNIRYISKCLESIFQKVKNTSPPKNTKLINIKNINTINSLIIYYSLVSSVFAAFAPVLLPDPNMSSHEKLSVKSAGNSPMPIAKPPLFLFPKKPPLF